MHLLYAICWDISEGKGGHAGRHGDPGARTIVSYKAPRNGYDGKSGSASIFVQTAEGPRIYTSAFDFQLNGFDIADENGDGIFEPGECVVIKSIYVSNIGMSHHLLYKRESAYSIIRRYTDTSTYLHSD